MNRIQEIIKSSNGKIFTVEFVKRSTGEIRVMNCRLGVTKGLAGGELRYMPEDHGLLPVYDIQAKGYRSLPLDGIRSIKANGKEFLIVK